MESEKDRHWGWYTLDANRNPVPVAGLPIDYERDPEKRRVGRTEVNGYLVSTVFLGLDHNFGEGPPMLFETMVFRDSDARDLTCERYATWDAAAAGHERIVKDVETWTPTPTPEPDDAA